MRMGVTARVDDGISGDAPPVPSTGKMMKYKGIKVSIERKSLSTLSSQSNRRQRGRSGGSKVGGGGGSNTWLRITCTVSHSS